MYNLHTQYLDLASGFHVIELRDQRGHRHLVQLSVGHDACPACGAVQLKDALDPEQAVREITEALNTSQQQMLTYAARHGVPLR